MNDCLRVPCTAFDGDCRLSAGPLVDVALAVKTATQAGAQGPFQVFDDATGQIIDLDLRGSKDEIVARIIRTYEAELPNSPQQQPRTSDGTPAEHGGRGRPKLGVIGREVTLLPRQWEWLSSQPGGASVTLRKLVEEARRSGAAKQKARQAQEAAYRFMSAMAGDRPGYEEAIRALFANDRANFERWTANWPRDVREYAGKLAFAEANPLGP